MPRFDRRRWLSPWLTILLAQPVAASEQRKPADWLFIGEHVLPMEADTQPQRQRGVSKVLAVTGDRISWMGEAPAPASLIGTDTEVIELGRRALLPGFIDAHGHLTFQAATVELANVASPPVGAVTNINKLIDTLKRYAESRALKPGDWIVGNGYDDSLLKERRHPTREDLDQVSTDHPIALIHVSGHLMTANSKALQIARINADTPDPHGGHIRRFKNSESPNGVLEETATYALRPYAFGTQKQPLEALRKALALYASHGITTIQDGATGVEGVTLIQTAAAAKLLTQDVIYYPVVQDITPIPAAWYIGRYRGRARAGGVKLVLDGSPQGKTAFLSQPYHVPPAGKDAGYRGYPIHSAAKVRQMVAHYLTAGVPMLAHANGDAAADLLIDAVEAALRTGNAGQTLPPPDHRTVMIHAQTVRDDQLDDMAQLGIIPSFFSAHTFYWGDWHRDSVLGPERAARISPLAGARQRQIPFTVHNDAPIVPPDILRLLWASTNRQTRSGRTLGKDQRVDTYTALLATTRFAAHQSFEEDRKGTLTVGKLADLVLLSRNPLTQKPSRLLKLEVEGTWSHGRQIYAAAPE